MVLCGHGTLLLENQGVFIHVQAAFSGSIAKDISGRQRVIRMGQVQSLLSFIRDERCATNLRRKIANAQFKAETASKERDFTTAISAYRDALGILDGTPVLDVYELIRADVLHGMGQVHGRLNQHAEAEACYVRALGLNKNCLGRDHMRNFAVLRELGALCERDGHVIEAASLYQRSFVGRLRMLGEDAPETLKSMLDVADANMSLGNFEAAMQLLEKAVVGLDETFGVQNQMTLCTMDKLCALYQKLNLRKEARRVSGRMIPHCRILFGFYSPITRAAVSRYVAASNRIDFPAEIMGILSLYKRSRDPKCLHVVDHFGRALMRAGLIRDAAELYERLLDDLVDIKGVACRATFKALCALCVCHERLGNVQETIDSYTNLVQLAYDTEQIHSWGKIAYMEKKIAEYTDRHRLLETERSDWGLNDPGICLNCGSLTCTTCSCECDVFVLSIRQQ